MLHGGVVGQQVNAAALKALAAFDMFHWHGRISPDILGQNIVPWLRKGLGHYDRRLQAVGQVLHQLFEGRRPARACYNYNQGMAGCVTQADCSAKILVGGINFY